MDGTAEHAARVEQTFLQRRVSRHKEWWTTTGRVSPVLRAERGGRWVEVWQADDGNETCFYRLSIQDTSPRFIGTRAAGAGDVHASDHVLGGVLGGPTGPLLTQDGWRDYADAWLRSTEPFPFPPGPLLAAAHAGDVQVVRSLATAASGEELSSALARAAGAGHTAVVACLLDHGADPNARVPWLRGGTALHAAAEDTFDPELLQMLLRRGADPNTRDAWGVTPLIAAVSHALDWVVQTGEPPHTACVAVLIAHGADPRIADYLGRSILTNPDLDTERHPELEPLVRLWGVQ